MDNDAICQNKELLEKIAGLVDKLQAKHRPQCFPKQSFPPCLPSDPPDPIDIPHAYLENITVSNRARSQPKGIKVTLDGRLADFYEPKEYFFEDPPARMPPWYRPRYPSVELRAGKFYSDCDCWKRNGLQDDCKRWDCGRPECLTKPMPECPPSFDPPLCGVRKGNSIVPPILSKGKETPLDSPFPPNSSRQPPIETSSPQPPMAPGIPCALHHQLLDFCSK